MHKTITSSVYFSLALFSIILCSHSFVLQTHNHGMIRFTDKFTTKLTDSSMLVYNNADLTQSPKNYTVGSAIKFVHILTGENILFATSSTLYLLNPFQMKIISQQSFFQNRTYVTQTLENETIYFGEESATLYFMNPSNGSLHLIDEDYNATQKQVFCLSGDRILLVNKAEPSFLVKDFANNVLFSHSGGSRRITDFAGTKYGVFALISNSTVTIWSEDNYTPLFEKHFRNQIEKVWMSSPNFIIVHTNGDHKLHLFSREFESIGQISLPNSCIGQYFLLREDVIAVPQSNHTIILYSIKDFQIANFGTLAVPNAFNGEKIDVVSMQNDLMALVTEKEIYIFDYTRKLILQTIPVSYQLAPQKGKTKYIDGSFFVQYVDSNSMKYLSTCHYSCSDCSGFGKQNCLNTLESPKGSDFALLDRRSSIKSKLNYIKSIPSSRRLEDYPSISTMGFNQNNTIISYIEAGYVGQYATEQTINVYMKSKVPIYIMVKTNEYNADGNDTCNFILNADGQSSNTQTQSGPIGYGKREAGAYSTTAPHYVINLKNLQGSTQYFVKVCPDATENNYQALRFKTKANNYKVAKYQFVLDTALTDTLINDFLCYIRDYLSFSNSNLYSTTGRQCGSGSSRLLAALETSSNRKRGLDDTASSMISILLYGNAFTESSDTTVDTALDTLSSSASLQFTDSDGNIVTVVNKTNMGALNLSAPVLPDNIVIAKTSSSITLSNVIINSMPGYIYAMILLSGSSPPAIYQIKNSAVLANGSSASNGSSFYWYYDGETPVVMDFQGLSKDQPYSIYYFATNEDVSPYQIRTSLYSKTIQTDNSIDTSLKIIIIVLSVLLAILIIVILACCIIRQKRRPMSAYKSDDVIQVRQAVKIQQQANAGLNLQDMRDEKDTLSKALADLEKANQEAMNINSFNVEENKSLVSPEEIERFKKKIKDLEAKITNLEQEKLCTICYERPKDLLLGCGHLMCSQCGKSMEECPFDKTRIKSKKKFFEIDN